MLLSYLVENALDGSVERLKERTIGVELFHRDIDYDTGQDAIVRVAANDVRKRLALHYQNSAVPGSEIRIGLAPGSYVPEFEPVHAPTNLPSSEVGTPTVLWRRSWVGWSVAGVLAAVCVVLAVQNLTMRSAESRSPHLSVLPWSHITAPGATIAVVAADSNFSFYKSLVHSDESLQVYTSRRWLDDVGTLVPSIPSLARMPITSIGDVIVAARIGSTLHAGGCSIAVRSGRMVQLDDFKSDRSIILLGSAYANPWVTLVNDRLNFHIEYDPVTGKQVCLNRAPREGESPVYVGTAGTPMPGMGYAIISLVRNLSRKGFVLLIAGTNMEGTEAAGELVTDVPRLTASLRNLGIDPAAKVEQLEILLRHYHMGTQSSQSEIIGYRVIP